MARDIKKEGKKRTCRYSRRGGAQKPTLREKENEIRVRIYSFETRETYGRGAGL